MAGQRRHKEFNTAVNTFPLNESRQGLLPPGRYYGFDNFTDGGGPGINISITHLGGISLIDDQGIKDVTPSGGYLTPQGVYIQDDTTILLPISNNTSGDPRIDLIIVTHVTTQVQGGAAAVYSVIEGTPSAVPVVPPLTNDAKEISLIQVLVPNGTTLFSGLTITPNKEPDFAQTQGARLNHANQFVDQINSHSQTSGTIPHDFDDVDILVNTQVNIPATGNSFTLPGAGANNSIATFSVPDGASTGLTIDFLMPVGLQFIGGGTVNTIDGVTYRPILMEGVVDVLFTSYTPVEDILVRMVLYPNEWRLLAFSESPKLIRDNTLTGISQQVSIDNIEGSWTTIAINSGDVTGQVPAASMTSIGGTLRFKTIGKTLHFQVALFAAFASTTAWNLDKLFVHSQPASTSYTFPVTPDTTDFDTQLTNVITDWLTGNNVFRFVAYGTALTGSFTLRYGGTIEIA